MKFAFERNFESELIYVDQLSEMGLDPSTSVIFYDQVLEQHSSVKAFLSNYENKKALQGGEDLKSLSSFEKEFAWLNEIAQEVSFKKMQLVCLGGGSLGDFVGFVASVFKRGVNFIQIPSTWLAAIDSAHGGKTALNFHNIKNQIGSFYPASKVFCVKELLFTQPQELAEDAAGELFKSAILSQNTKLHEMFKNEIKIDKELIWDHLPNAIELKYQIIERDPFESLGIRYLLNLGHTMGHVFETAHKFSHGKAIAVGMIYSLKFSEKQYSSENKFSHIIAILKQQFKNEYDFALANPIVQEKVEALLLADKKRSAKDSVHFICTRDLGDCQVEEIKLSDLVLEGKKQGFIKKD
ncbi:MAG: 3-dehydroquinate synthase family protein [Bdellovibrionota bacterium]|nr:3-dehydroquinate synthase family protein [Bdellovibrionota bacterium]